MLYKGLPLKVFPMLFMNRTISRLLRYNFSFDMWLRYLQVGNLIFDNTRESYRRMMLLKIEFLLRK